MKHFGIVVQNAIISGLQNKTNWPLHVLVTGQLFLSRWFYLVLTTHNGNKATWTSLLYFTFLCPIKI